jgi:pyruvate/2-oxoglutarate dehydrogenase complex dihydrolipoamide dehydrogenase (E3) component
MVNQRGSVVSNTAVIEKAASEGKTLVRQLEKVEVKFETGKQVNLDMVKKENPDVVVLDTGATPTSLDIPRNNESRIVSFADVLQEIIEVGTQVVVTGGNQVGCETAEYLAEKGKQVTIVEMLDTLATNLPARIRHYFLFKLGMKGINMLTGAKCQRITKEGVEIINRTGRRLTLKADTIVFAVGSRSNNQLAKELEGSGKLVLMIGDCVQPRKIMDAVNEGLRTALEI